MPFWDEPEGRRQHWQDRILHHSQGPKGTLQVIQDLATRSLCFGNLVRQSTMLLAEPSKLVLSYTRAMMAAELFLRAEPRRALIVGLGGGSLAKFLFHHHPNCQIDIVELREDVVKVAYGYFMLPEDRRLQVTIGDGIDYVRQSRTQYDLVFLDMFDQQGMIPEANNLAFFRACRDRLTPRGVCSANLWNIQHRLFRGYTQVMRQAFPNSLLRMPLGRRANELYFGFTEAYPRRELFHLAPQAQRLIQRFDLEYDLYLRLLQRFNTPFYQRFWYWLRGMGI